MKKTKFISSLSVAGLIALALASCGTTKKPSNPKDPTDDPGTGGESGETTEKDLAYADSAYEYVADPATKYEPLRVSDNHVNYTFYNTVYKKDSKGDLSFENNKLYSMALNSNQELKYLPIPESNREGYEFGGWYVDFGLSTQFYQKEVPDVKEGTVECYARWVNTGDKIYVSPDGNPESKGTSKSKTTTIWEAARTYKPGATITMAEGEYKTFLDLPIMFGKDGDSRHITKVEGNNSTINFTGMTENDANMGIKLAADYFRISDLTITSAGDNGLLVGSSNNIISNCTFTECHDTGLQISRYSSSIQPFIEQWPSNNLILNCTSYNNSDTKGEDADGFAAKLTVGYNNVFDGCIAAYNVDDGWDLYAKTDSGPIGLVKILNCLSIGNGHHLSTDTKTINKNFSGDGNGFKLGGSGVPGEVIVDNCIAAYNNAHGFTDNSNPGVISISNCTSINNGQFGEKEYDNFNINRDSIKTNKNYYKGLFSYYTDAANTAKKCDEANGSINDAILYYNNEYYKLTGTTSTQVTDKDINGTNPGFTGSKIVTKFTMPAGACNATDPITKFTSGAAAAMAALRNEDGSINLGSLFKMGTNINSATFHVGADLAKDSMDKYNHSVFSTIPDNETEDQRIAREMYDSLDLAINNVAVYDDIYLPTTLLARPFTWTSSNENVLKISTLASDMITGDHKTNSTKAVIQGRIDTDTEVKLTATITVGSVTLTKEFTVTLQALDPRVGVISNVNDITILNTETLPDITNAEVYDYTATKIKLNAGSDYTQNITIKYSNEYDKTLAYSSATTVSGLDANKPGYYIINYSFVITGYKAVTYTRYISIVNANDTYEVLNSKTQLGYIIDDEVSLNTLVSYNQGELYAVLVHSDEAAPTAEQILTAYTTTSTYASAVVKYNLTGLNVVPVLAISELNYVPGSDVTAYLFIKNHVGNGKVYAVENIHPTELIATYADLENALNSSNSANYKKAYKVVADIDCKHTLWQQSKSSIAFQGYFDGNFKTISNLDIQVTGSKGGGLFFEAKNAIIKNVKIEEIHLSQPNAATEQGNGSKGALIGVISGQCTVTNCIVSNCGVQAYERASGAIGEITGPSTQMDKCEILIDGIIVTANKKAPSDNPYYYSVCSQVVMKNDKGEESYSGGKYVGGIVAHIQYSSANIDTIIRNCFADVTVVCVNQHSAGIVGRIDNRKDNCTVLIDNCVFGGTVINKADTYTGGICSAVSSGTASFTNCVNYGSLMSKSIGQIMGLNSMAYNTVGTTKIYYVPEKFGFENNYYMIPDFDPETDVVKYGDEETYYKTITENKEYNGTAVYAKNIFDRDYWLNTMHINLDTINFTYNQSTLAMNWTLTAFEA